MAGCIWFFAELAYISWVVCKDAHIISLPGSGRSASSRTQTRRSQRSLRSTTVIFLACLGTLRTSALTAPTCGSPAIAQRTRMATATIPSILTMSKKAPQAVTPWVTIWMIPAMRTGLKLWATVWSTFPFAMFMVLVSKAHKFYQLQENVWVVIQNMYREWDIRQNRDTGGFPYVKYGNNWHVKG